MKQQLQQLILDALNALQKQGQLPIDKLPEIQIERTKQKSHGDFACNIAMLLAKPTRSNPRQLAEQIIAAIAPADYLERCEIAGPGFINFFVTQQEQAAVIAEILKQAQQYGQSDKHKGERVIVEFVSSNPTGPLHVGHGRGAAYGATLSNLLDAVGYDVHREYYVNDAGRQMRILTTSIWLRYLELHGIELRFPQAGYQGDYISDIAKQVDDTFSDTLVFPTDAWAKDLPADEEQGGDKDKHMDAIIEQCQRLLDDKFQAVLKLGLDDILTGIKQDLHNFGVDFDEWFSEQSLYDRDAISDCLSKLKANNYTYEQDGALWFRSTEFDDNKDRVLLKANGQPTYLTPDIAYHMHKFDRGFDQVIDVLGADHHGYVPRVKAAVAAMGYNAEHMDAPLIQFASLWRGGKKVQMSTRSGSYVTLRELYEEVGVDAARFFYIVRRHEQHLDFDLELAKSQSNENPVYYIQYAHARLCSVFSSLAEKDLSFEQNLGLQHLNLLELDHEQKLLAQLAEYPELVEHAAAQHEPHIIAQFLRDLSGSFHSYYNACKFILDDDKLRNARLCLAKATQQVIMNGLTLLGLSAPEKM